MLLTAPDFGRLGLQLVDGAVLDQQGTPAIRAIYQDAAGKLVVLFAGIGRPDVRHAFWLEREGYVSLQWRRGAMIFALVAPTDSPELSQIVELVGAAVARIPMPAAMESAPVQVPSPAEPPPAAMGVVETPLLETSPVQSIAVPLARPTMPAASPPTDDAEVRTIRPDELLTGADGNAPEPL